MAFTPLSSLILKSAKKYKIEDSAKASLIIKVARDVVCRIFSKVNSQPEKLITKISFERDLLILGVANASVSHELHLRQNDVIEDMNRMLPEPWVKNIKIKIF